MIEIDIDDLSRFVKKYIFIDTYIYYVCMQLEISAVDAFFVAVTSVIARKRKFSLRRYRQRGEKASTKIELPDVKS